MKRERMSPRYMTRISEICGFIKRARIQQSIINRKDDRYRMSGEVRTLPFELRSVYCFLDSDARHKLI